MKYFSMVLLMFLALSIAHAIPGDIIRSQSLAGQPTNGVRGLAMDWDTGMIWVAGPQQWETVKFTTMDPETMSAGTWLTAAEHFVYWCHDIGFGYEDGGKKYLLIVDSGLGFTKLVDPADGSWDGCLPDHYSISTAGCSVDWTDNYVYLCSMYDSDIVYYDGSSYNTFTSITGDANRATAVGWDHLFILKADPYFTIEVYQLSGSFIESIPLNGWASENYVSGLSCGRENVAGNNETLFFADFVTYQVHEIEVGDYTTGGSLTQSTWGNIKAVPYQ